MKRYIALLLCVSVVFGFSACGKNRGGELDEEKFDYETLAETGEVVESGEQDGFIYHSLSDGTVTVSRYTGDAERVELPAEINGAAVAAVGDGAFMGNENVTEVVLPQSVVSIGTEAFSGCTALQNIVWGDSVSYVGGRAFAETPYYLNNTDEFFCVGGGVLLRYGGSDAEVTVPENIKCISGAFEDNAMVSKVILPEGLTHISSFAFTSCISLKEINFPESLLYIGERAFAKCVSLPEIILPGSVMEIGKMSFLYCTSSTTLQLSRRLSQIPVSAFQSCTGIESLEIPESVKKIDEQAFLRCKELREVIVPDSVQEIKELAFSNCSPELVIICGESSPAKAFCELYSIGWKEN